MASNNMPHVKYVYDLPFMVNRTICRILDQSDKWEELAGKYMGYKMPDIQAMRRLQVRSPTEELLCLWGQKNHTIYELFVLLSKMQHHQAMVVLKPFIDPKYHVLINEGEENISRLLSALEDTERQVSEGGRRNTATTMSTNLDGNENLNFNIHTSYEAYAQKHEEKILNVPKPTVNASNRNSAVPTSPLAASRLAELGYAAEQAKALSNRETVSSQLSPSTPSTRKESEDSSLLTDALRGSIPQIHYKELQIATNQWDPKNILGRGGFGVVFRGTWKNTQVAIKRIEQKGGSDAAGGSYQAQLEQSFKELKILNSVRHDNILSLYGFSVGGEQPCLVYQLMPNGSLEDRLQCRGGTSPLTWVRRHSIARGTARGLQFLHTINDKPLIHGDIKSANILLDANWQPRIGDFGLAREGPIAKYTHIKVTRVHGTRPYLPDEFLRSKQISTKVDTYSFGIVLFEIATGQRAFDEKREEHKLLKDLIQKSDLSQLMDPRAPAEPHNPSIGPLVFHELVTLGQKCTAYRSNDRPKMVTVLQDLENLEEQRGIVSRAQSIIYTPSPCPSNPLEIQMLYDALTQQRRTSLGTETPWNGLVESHQFPHRSGMETHRTRLQGSLQVDIPTQQDATQNYYLTPSPQRLMASPQGLSPNFQRYLPQNPSHALSQAASSFLPSVSPSFVIQDATGSLPSTQPNLNPFLSPSPSPQLGVSSNASALPLNYQFAPDMSPGTYNNPNQHPHFVNQHYFPPPPELLQESPLLRDQRQNEHSNLDSSYNSSSRQQLTESDVESSSQPSVLMPTIIPEATQFQISPEGTPSSYIPDISLLGIREPDTISVPITSADEEVMCVSRDQETGVDSVNLAVSIRQSGVHSSEQLSTPPHCAPTVSSISH